MRYVASLCLAALLAILLAFHPEPAYPQQSAFGLSLNRPTSLAVTTASGNVVLGAQGGTALIWNTGAVAARIRNGTSSTTTALTTDHVVPAGACVAISVAPSSYIAGITASGSTTLEISQGFGPLACSVSAIGAGGTFTAVQSGTWTVQPGNTANTTPWLVTPTPSSAAGAGVAPVTSAALAANQVVKASAGNLFSFEVSADTTLSAAAWWIMIYDATAAPSDGAVTPAKCYALPLGTTSYAAAFNTPLAFATGITIGVSTTGCFNKTASTHAFISGDAK